MGLEVSKIDWNGEPSSREKVYLVVILILIIAAFARLLWIPTYKNIKQRKVEIGNIRLQITPLEEFLSTNRQVEQQKPVISKEVIDRRFEDALKGKNDNPHQIISDVTSEITSRKNIGNMTLTNIAFEVPKAESGYVKIPIRVEIVGTFPSLQRYLSKLESLDYLFTVDNVKLGASAEHPGMITGELSGTLYIAASAAGGRADYGGSGAKGPEAQEPGTEEPEEKK